MKHTKENNKCPCCSDKLFADCCQPVIEDHSNAKTAEQLMRSRYTAFTLANNQYLMDSWAQETRPKEIYAEEESIQWLNLEVEKCEKGSSGDEDGYVTFTARFLSSGHLCRLHEKSSFIKDGGLWYYLDGETESDTEKVGRNAPCPCGSGKKYKRCCC
jgi:SEC-C motif domain protein